MRARAWIATATGLATLTTAALVAGAATGASAGVTLQPPLPGTTTSAGTLVLADTLANNGKGTSSFTVSWRKADGTTAPTVQTVAATSKNACNLDSRNATPYLTISGSAGGSSSSVGIGSQGDIGVNSESTGGACSQVNLSAGEALTIKVASLPGQLGSTSVDGAGFDLNLSGSVVLQAIFKKDGHEIGGAEFQSGLSSPAPLNPARPHDLLDWCNQGTVNSGPQSGTPGTNECYWQIPSLKKYKDGEGPTYTSDGRITSGSGLSTEAYGNRWDEVVLSATSYTYTDGNGVEQTVPPKANNNPAFSLEGGQQWTGWTGTPQGGPTTFNLVTTSEYTATCGTTGTETSGGVTVTYTRVDDYTGSACAPKAYNVSLTTSSSGSVFSLQTDQADTSGTWLLQFARDYTTPVSNDPELAVDFSNGTVANAARTVGYCPTSAFTYTSTPWAHQQTVSGTSLQQWAYASSPNPPVADPTVVKAGSSSYDFDSTTGGAQYACKYATSTELVTVNGVQVQRWVDWVWMSGDVIWLGK